MVTYVFKVIHISYMIFMMVSILKSIGWPRIHFYHSPPPQWILCDSFNQSFSVRVPYPNTELYGGTNPFPQHFTTPHPPSKCLKWPVAHSTIPVQTKYKHCHVTRVRVNTSWPLSGLQHTQQYWLHRQCNHKKYVASIYLLLIILSLLL